jgi:hypothetical protein
VLVRTGGVSEGPVDRLGSSENPLSCSSLAQLWRSILRGSRPEGRGSASKWYQSLILSVYCRQREPEEKEDRVLKLCDDCCKVRNSQ